MMNMRKEKQTINKIKEKLLTNKAIISNADKGNSLIITYLDEYHKEKSQISYLTVTSLSLRVTLLRNFKENLEARLMNAN
jgi:hypothetical protein